VVGCGRIVRPRLVSTFILGLAAGGLAGCGSKGNPEQEKATAEIRATCERLVALEGTDPPPASSATSGSAVSGSMLGSLRTLVEVLGSSAPMTVPAQTRCAADMHLYRGASEAGFKCIDTCSQGGSFAGAKACFDKCILDDEALETARRSSRKQRDVNARGWLGSAASQPTTATSAKVGDAKGREWQITVDLPDQPVPATPGVWRIEKTSALVAPVVKVSLRDQEGSLKDTALLEEGPPGAAEIKEREEKGKFLLARVGPDPIMSRAGDQSKNRDKLLVQVVYDKDDVRISCGVNVNLLDLDDGLIDAIVAWTENLCGSVAFKP